MADAVTAVNAEIGDSCEDAYPVNWAKMQSNVVFVLPVGEGLLTKDVTAYSRALKVQTQNGIAALKLEPLPSN